MRREGGYALVEMLATLVIVGLTSAVMLSGLGAAQRVWDHLDSSNNMGDIIAGAQMVLRDRLEHIFPATRYDKIPSYADMDGTSDKFVFLATPRNVQAPAETRRYQLAVAPNGDLVLSSALDTAADPNAISESLVLLHNVQGIDIAYFGVAPPDNQPQWRYVWQQRPAPPQLIRVRVHFAPQDPRVWPELLVKPFATVDSMCVLMVTTKTCRGRPIVRPQT